MKKSTTKTKSNVGYYIVSKFLTFVGHLYYGEKIIGKENMLNEDGMILAINHVSNVDAYILFRLSKKPVHILGKIELFKHFGWFFRMMKVIPVDRSKKNPIAVNEVINLLNDGEVVGIFPEGTFRKNVLLLPFKAGVINFAEKTNKPIIPIVIKGKFKFRSKPIINILKPIYINNIKGDKVEYLYNIMLKELLD